jgi:hypothetical protein
MEMTKATLRTTILALVSLGIWIGDARADKAQLEEKLSQSLSVKLEDVTITQALELIGQKAGVKIVLAPEAVWKLPEGEQTRLSVTLEGRLAESLEKMLNSFFLRYAVGSDSLTIYPRPELKRIIGRPTAGELKLLGNIYGNKMWLSTGQAEISEQFVQQAINAMAQEPVSIVGVNDMRQIGTIMAPMGGKSTSSSASPHDPNSPKGTPLTLALLLDETERVYTPPKTWYIEGPAFPRQISEIKIVKREEFWRTQLDQVIDVSFSGEKGESVVRKLAAWAGLDVQIADPVTARALGREITLEGQNVKLVDALDKALSILGAGREMRDGVLRVYYVAPEKPVSESSQQAASEPQGGGGYVGKISIPMDGGRYFIEFMLRESDLTDELRALRQEKIKEILAGASKTGQATK